MGDGRFKPGDPRTRELASKGGSRRADVRRKASGQAPYEGTVLDVMDAAGLVGDSWQAWRAINAAIYGLPLDPEALAIFRRHSEREQPPAQQVREVCLAVGRRGGKTHNMAVNAAFLAVRFDANRLTSGETAVVPILAADRKQARQVFGYLKGIFTLPEFAPFVHRVLKESIELHNGVNVEVHTASYRTIRGYTVVSAVLDEVAFWRTDDGSANPDTEVLAALRPAMATVPDAMLIMASSPYAATGVLYQTYERYFGQDDPHTLVLNADTRSLNPNVPQSYIDRAFEEDPASAGSEYGQDGRVAFRRDVEQFLDPAAVDAVVVPDRRELPPLGGTKHVAFVDPSGGSQDSFTLAIAHAEKDVAVLDALREVRPPFSPDDVVKDFAALLRTYRITTVTGDRYAGEWPRERFGAHGITYKPSEKTKSDIYREFVAPVNAERVALLDVPVLRAQLVALERRVARGGKDSIDHPRGGRDDVANAAAGALVMLQTRTGKFDLVFGGDGEGWIGGKKIYNEGLYTVTVLEDGTRWYEPRSKTEAPE
jgi:hypothetical protein